MIKQEIIEKISKYFKLTNFEAEKIYDDIFVSIIQGVKEDNIADITNLGEFIIKYNSADSSNKKTVEFLPTLSLEDEINQRSFEEQRQFEPAKFVNPEETVKPVTETIMPPAAINPPPVESKVEQNMEKEIPDDKHSVEDEIKRKREEILSKITTPKVEQTKAPEVYESKTVIPPVVIPGVQAPVTSKFEETTKEIKEEIFESGTKIEEKTEKTTEIISETKNEVEEVTEKSFSDYFTEISKEEKSVPSQINMTSTPVPPPVVENTTPPPVETVIPPSAVELHNEITGDHSKTNEYQTTINPMPYANGNGNGNGNGNVEQFEHRLQDNSYYIWYKDSEPNTTDTQTMSYEYELLYQATKEAEYKSKLRIYVTTFIMFFSVVLLLLIFSPVIYKYFFTPKEEQKTEEVQQEQGTTEEPQQNTNQASVNSLESTPPVNNNNTQNTTTQETPKQEQPVQQQPVQEQPKQEQPKQEQPKQEQPKQNTSQNLPGVTKSGMGWMDDNNKVIYVQLENGKYTIQESAWDSDAKANKRISAVGSLVPGLNGSVLKVDLGTKGTWYRARFGEFTTIEEAQKKAAELRNKEKGKLHAMLLAFFWYT